MRTDNFPTEHDAWAHIAMPHRMMTWSVIFLLPLALAVPAESDLIGHLSDEFEDAGTLGDWRRINVVEGWHADQLEAWDIAGGRMVMTPHTTTWYQDYRGPMAYKHASGNFVFTTEVHISDRDDVGNSDANDVPNDSQFSLGGIMIRAPRSTSSGAADWQPGGENYVFLSLGYGNSPAPRFEFEVKTTTDSTSTLELSPSSRSSATLQLARLNRYVIALLKTPADDWIVHRRFERNDLPETLQLGLVTYTDWDKASTYAPLFHNSNTLTTGLSPDPSSDPQRPFDPDLSAAFEFARVWSPSVPRHLAGLDLTDSNLVPDEDLLAFLGANAVPEPSAIWLGVAIALINCRRRRASRREMSSELRRPHRNGTALDRPPACFQ